MRLIVRKMNLRRRYRAVSIIFVFIFHGMRKDQIITAIEEGWLEQEFYGHLPQSDEGDEAAKDYVDDFILTLLEMAAEEVIEGTEYAIQDNRLSAAKLGDIRLR